jgi:hypothetical protein
MLATIAPCYPESNSILRVPSRSSLLLNRGGMDNKEIRRSNLLLLIAEFGSAAALADKTGIDDTYLRNIKNQVREMGDELARRIEENLGRPRGWMDTTQDRAADSHAHDLLLDYTNATPEWQLTLRLLAKVSPDRQPEIATALNKLLAGSVQGETLSGNLDQRKPFFNSRLGDKKGHARERKSESQDIQKKRTRK